MFSSNSSSQFFHSSYSCHSGQSSSHSSILVTVICHAHNHKDYIRDAIEGFLLQKTTFGMEILIHDDCSSDGTTQIIREYEALYPDLIRGIYQDRNRYSDSVMDWYGFLYSKARGKYVALTDADDYWTDPLKLQKQVAVLEDDDSLMACITSCEIVDQYGNPSGKLIQAVPGNRKGRYSLRNFLNDHHCWPVTTVLYRQRNMDKVFERNQLMENEIMSDWTFWISLLIEGDCYFLEDVTAAYRINPTSQTHTNVDDRRIGQARLNFILLPIVANLLPEGYDDVRFKLLNDNSSWWWQLANAYKHNHQYMRMFACLVVSAYRYLRYKLISGIVLIIQ